MKKHWFTAFLTSHYSSGKKLGLDLGSGYRNWHESFKCEYIAIDLPATVKQPKKSQPDVCSTATSLPFKENTFDFLSCYSVLPHVNDIDEALKEIFRVMTKNSVAVIIVQNQRAMSLNKNSYFRNPMDSKKLHEKLIFHGFKSIKHHNLKTLFYSFYYNLTSVYAYAIVKPIKDN